MKIINTYPTKAIKLYHRKPGDVVTIHKNDGTEPDPNFYMVTDRELNAACRSLINLSTGDIVGFHTCTRTLVYRDAELMPGDPS